MHTMFTMFNCPLAACRGVQIMLGVVYPAECAALSSVIGFIFILSSSMINIE